MRFLVKLSGEYIVEADDEEDVPNRLADMIEYNNSTVGTEFFDSLSVEEVEELHEPNEMAPSIIPILRDKNG